MEVPLKTKNRAAVLFSNLTLGHIYGENLIQKDACTPVFILALFMIAKTWKQPKCSSAYEWIKKMRYLYIMEYYSAIRRNEIISFAAT